MSNKNPQIKIVEEYGFVLFEIKENFKTKTELKKAISHLKEYKRKFTSEMKTEKRVDFLLRKENNEFDIFSITDINNFTNSFIEQQK